MAKVTVIEDYNRLRSVRRMVKDGKVPSPSEIVKRSRTPVSMELARKLFNQVSKEITEKVSTQVGKTLERGKTQVKHNEQVARRPDPIQKSRATYGIKS